MIFKLAEDFNDDYFTAKGFILLADIYIDQGNNFQAKAALESIIVSYSGNQDLVNEARKKNEKILQKEIQDTNIKVSPIYIDILEEGIDDELDTYQNILELVDENYEVEVPDSLMPRSNSILKNENEKK